MAREARDFVDEAALVRIFSSNLDNRTTGKASKMANKWTASLQLRKLCDCSTSHYRMIRALARPSKLLYMSRI